MSNIARTRLSFCLTLLLLFTTFFTSFPVMIQPSMAYAATTSTNLALATNGATVSSSSSIESLPDWAMANINDGLKTSTSGTSLGWTSSANPNNAWVQIDLGANQTLNQVKLYPRTDGSAAGGGFPIDFNIEVSSDEQNWTTVDVETNYPFPNPAVGQEFNFTSVTAQYVRVTGTKLGQDEFNTYYMQFAEIEVYNAVVSAPPSLTADTTDNGINHDIVITFADDVAWRNAIKAVKVGTKTLAEADYTISAGTITIKAGTLRIGSHDITVRADGYVNATEVQAVLNLNVYAGEGAGTANDPYRIATANQLNAVRYHLESGVYFKLTADIDLSSYQTGEGWMPIGDSDTPFQGNMDGNGYKIANLKIIRPSGQYIGLFGYVGENSVVASIWLENASVSGASLVGGLVGVNKGTISNSSATGSVSGSDYTVGGLVGENAGTISNSSATGSVSGSGSGYTVGGLVGENSYLIEDNVYIGTINNSYATGNVSGQRDVGGLAGFSIGYISNSFATGSVSGSGNNVGGLVGYSMGTVSNSYATGSVSGASGTGGLVGYDVFGGTAITFSFYDSETTGQSDTGKGDGQLTAAMKTQSIYTVANWDFANTWGIGSTRNNGYPYLQAMLRNVTYDGNESTAGDVPTDGNLYWLGETVTVLGNTDNLMRTGYTFAGWNTASDGSGTSYSAADTFSIGSLGVTLYAKWNPSVTYDNNSADEGTVPANSITYEQRATVTVLGNTGDLVKDGYTFVGWNTALDGSGMRYREGDSFNIGVTRVTLYAEWLSANALLSDLSVDQGILTPEFASSERIYMADVASTVSSLNISITKADPSQTITVTGATFISVTDNVYYSYSASNLIEGSNPIRILVKAEDGTENPYHLTVNREAAASSNAFLSGLTLSSGMLSPAFASGTANYTSNVSNGVSSLTVTASVIDSNATVAVNGTAVTSGQSSVAIALIEGGNPITVVVTAQDRTTKQTYIVNVSRATAITAGSGMPIPVTTEPVSITVPSEVTNAEIAVTPVTAGSNKEATLPLVEVQAVTSLGNVSVTIPDGTKITAPANWDGTIKLPQVHSNDSVTVNGGSVNAVIEIGSTDVSLTFDKAVRLLIPNQGGKLSGYVRNGVFTPISGTITADTQTAADNEIPAGGDASITVGNDLVIWTKHFTQFVSYTQVAQSNSGGGGGGGSAAISGTIAAASGGTLTLNGATIEVPAGAVASDIQVTVDKVSDTSILPIDSTLQLASEVYEIKKDRDGDFSKPVVVTLPFDKMKVDFAKKSVGVYWLNEQTDKWVQLDDLKVDEAKGTASGSVKHFTKFVVLASDKIESGQPQTNEENFSDIKGHWAETGIKQAVSGGIVSGYTDGTFKPNRTVTRAEFAVMLMNMLKLQGEGAALKFTDTAKIGAWAQKAVAQAVQADIIKGYKDGAFRPDAEITRTEMAAMIAKALGLEVEAGAATGFADDASIPSWAKGAVVELKQLGIINGKGGNQFDPAGKATRAEAVTMLLKMQEQMND